MTEVIKKVGRVMAEPQTIHRQTENGEGQVIWSHISEHPPETIEAHGYFPTLRTGFRRHDIINVVASAYSARPAYYQLVVTKAPTTGIVTVRRMAPPVYVEAPAEDSPFEVLGLNPSGPHGQGITEADVDAAYRRVSKRVHPDKGGTEAEFRRLGEAKDACLAILREAQKLNSDPRKAA